ncbi:MAG: methanogenesis marker 7 protein [Methanoregulaceae archaeon]|nr:methanogenesis marker 7 protein [Methanoregulaceae archaeon]
MNLVPVTYKGGIYRHDEIMDLIEDLGGYIIQKHVLAQEVVLQALVPKEDIPLIASIARPLTGEIIPSPLVGTEIAVITMSLEIHHLPHASCDVAEYIRRNGAKTNMVGLSRGFGKRIAQLNDEERDVINEHDLAVFLLGDFQTCIQYKFPVLRRGITIPIVISGGPDKETLQNIIDPPVEGYVGNIGRFMHRTKESEELEKLDEVVSEITRVLDNKRDEMAKDPPSVSPARLMDVINEQVEEIHDVLSPTPITVQMMGLRVKLPYDTYAPVLRKLTLDGEVKVGEVADVIPSRMRDYILIRIKPFSETNIMV